MECHEARILMTFVRRKIETVDASERAALQTHLDGCADCAAHAFAERQVDNQLSGLMQDVPVPADLKGKVLSRLAQQRPARPWRWLAAAAVAATILFGLASAAVWHGSRPPEVTFEDIQQYSAQGVSDKAFDKAGVVLSAPSEFNSAYLRRVEIVDFKGQRVARLSYRRNNNDGSSALADVLVLPHQKFRFEQLPEGDVPGANIWIKVQNLKDLKEPVEKHVDRPAVTFIIMYNGNPRLLLHQAH